MAKIYTKKGDGGKTSTFLGAMGKDDLLAEVLGNLDELNSWIGEIRLMNYLDEELKRIQNNLMTISSEIAGSKKTIKAGEVEHLEKLIDKLSEDLPPLSNFIYPVGEVQVTRSVARRVERSVVALKVTKNIIKYLNRLSDALFMMARWVNNKNGVKEEIWK
jgi:cob(I)alamin adenosyltransferase